MITSKRRNIAAGLALVYLGVWSLGAYGQALDTYIAPEDLRPIQSATAAADEIKAIDARPIPTLPELMLDEIRLADRKSAVYANVGSRSIEVPDLNAAREKFRSRIADMFHKPCDKSIVEKQINELTFEVRKVIPPSYMSVFQQSIGNPDLSMKFGDALAKIQGSPNCATINKMSEIELTRYAVGYLDFWAENINALKSDYAKQSPMATQLAAAWKKRSQSISKLLEDQRTSNIQSFISYLPYIVLTFCAFGLVLIAVIRIFDREVQMEWVASGQVIQFASVIVLLIIVSSLGLLHILEKEGIGTLLGAIGGYVLSQGVGRAAARAATNTAAQLVNQPPPSPRPPGAPSP